MKQKENLLPCSISWIAFSAAVSFPGLILIVIQAGLEVPVHRKYAEDWMEYSPYFRVFDSLED